MKENEDLQNRINLYDRLIDEIRRETKKNMLKVISDTAIALNNKNLNRVFSELNREAMYKVSNFNFFSVKLIKLIGILFCDFSTFAV